MMKKFLTTLSVLIFSVSMVMAVPTTDLNKPKVLVKDNDINAGAKVTWTSDKVWLMDGFVYVEEGAELTIEAGTVVKSVEDPSTGDIATALVICRGAKLYAEGNAFQPIIFTAEADSVALPDYDSNDGVDWKIDGGLWGGVVMCGKSKLNVANEFLVEGLPDDPQKRGYYGGDDDDDNSGVLRYVSIRYTGITVEANKELQGLTLGCVGRGTTIDYVESFNSFDDGYEWFGGTVNTSHLVSAFNDDDCYDYDEGFRGHGQFWFAIQHPERGNRVGEYDSGNSGVLTLEPLAKPVLYNCTYIGSGVNSINSKNDYMLIYKEYGGGEHYNGIFMDFRGHAVSIDSGSGETSYQRLQRGEIKLENNLWYQIGSGLGKKKFEVNYLSDPTKHNIVVDPGLRGISRDTDGGLDPRPVTGSAALTSPMKAYPADPFFKEVNYMGAFGPDENWLEGWTALWQNGIAGEIMSSMKEWSTSEEMPKEYSLMQNYPNPFNPMTTIQFSLPGENKVRLTIFNVIGQVIVTLIDGVRPAGEHYVQWDAAKLPGGVYFYQLEVGTQVYVKKLMLVK